MQFHGEKREQNNIFSETCRLYSRCGSWPSRSEPGGTGPNSSEGEPVTCHTGSHRSISKVFISTHADDAVLPVDGTQLLQTTQKQLIGRVVGLSRLHHLPTEPQHLDTHTGALQQNKASMEGFIHPGHETVHWLILYELKSWLFYDFP